MIIKKLKKIINLYLKIKETISKKKKKIKETIHLKLGMTKNLSCLSRSNPHNFLCPKRQWGQEWDLITSLCAVREYIRPNPALSATLPLIRPYILAFQRADLPWIPSFGECQVAVSPWSTHIIEFLVMEPTCNKYSLNKI